MATDSEVIWRIKDQHPTWNLLAALDESGSYETDVTEIYRDGDRNGRFNPSIKAAQELLVQARAA